MEISRPYEPIFTTSIKSLAKVKLQGHPELSQNEIYQSIAFSALKSNENFLDYTLLLYVDALCFQKNDDNSTFVTIPFASINSVVILPNFPDVCFIHFRRNDYGMYVIFRVKKISYLSKITESICKWSDFSCSDSEGTENTLTPPASSTEGKISKLAKKNAKVSKPPVIVQQSGKKLREIVKKYSHSPHRNASKSYANAGTQACGKEAKPQKPNAVKYCNLARINKPHEEVFNKEITSHKRNNHSHPEPQNEEGKKQCRILLEPCKRKYAENDAVKGGESTPTQEHGKWTILLPNRDNISKSKIIQVKEDGRPHAPGYSKHRENVVVAKPSVNISSTCSSSIVSKLFDTHGREVKTIYPSYMNTLRMSPTSLRNERLVQILNTPLTLNS